MTKHQFSIEYVHQSNQNWYLAVVLHTLTNAERFNIHEMDVEWVEQEGVVYNEIHEKISVMTVKYSNTMEKRKF